jgi:arylsulfatase A-like enzyme
MKLIKHLFIFAFVLLLNCANAIHAKKPNFVIIIADDHGVYHSSAYGSPEFKTPNIQAMADEGIRFNDAYVASPACAPSRAALFTGLMPYNNGIVGNHETELKSNVKSLIPNLIDQGYEVVFQGKVAHGALKHYKGYIPKKVNMLERGNKWDVSLQIVDDYLKNRTDTSRPLALFIGCTDTHTPWVNENKVRIKPENVVIPQRIFDTPEARLEMGRYIESAENLDRKIGKARELSNKYLDPNNTLTIYTSDHGFAWPFAKWSLYETGIRTSLIAVWPGKIKPNTATKAMVSWIDLMPTLIDIAGGKTSENIDGKPFTDVLLGKTKKHRKVIFATHKGDKGFNVYPIRSVRVGDYKYILNLHPEFYYSTHTDLLGKESIHGGQHWPSYVEAAKTNPAAATFLRDYHSSPAEELYNIKKDPYEMNNLADSPKYSKKLKELRERIEIRMKEVEDDKSLSGEPRLLKDNPLPRVLNIKQN